MSRASPVKAILWSSVTYVTQPSVCPGVSNTVRYWTELWQDNDKTIGTSHLTHSDKQQSLTIFYQQQKTTWWISEWVCVMFSVHVFRKWCDLPLRAECPLRLRCVWRWRSSAQTHSSSAVPSQWCDPHDSECLLTENTQTHHHHHTLKLTA